MFSHYTRELHFIRELGAEFARRFPKVAGRLGLSELECADPHVERLLQGYALLAGRVGMRLDAEYPAIPRALIERMCPSLTSPVPSMAVAQFRVDPTRRSLGSGFVVERDTVLRTRANAQAADCEFRTAHAVQLLPIELEAAEYTSALHELAGINLPGRAPSAALLRLRLRAHNSTFRELSIERLPFFIAGDDAISASLYEQLIAHAQQIIVRWRDRGQPAHALSTASPVVRQVGFDDEQALLPVTAPAFRGHRLLQEYFALPARFDFVELTGLQQALQRCGSDRVELLVPLTRLEPTLENAIDAERLLLFTTPICNLFPRTCARLALRTGEQSFKLDPDRSRPHHFDVHSVSKVWAYGTDSTGDRELQPGYSTRTGTADPLYYWIERRARTLDPYAQRQHAGVGYQPSDVYLTLSGPGVAQSRAALGLRELAVHTLCTNGALPSRLKLDRAGEDFLLQSGAPAEGVRCVVAPSAARAISLEGELAWSLLSRLSANYLSIHYLSSDARAGAAEALRELLGLYAQLANPKLDKHADAVRAVASAPIVGPLPQPGARAFARGLQVRLELDEQAHMGYRAFTLASVLSELFAQHATPHSFAQTVLSTTQRGAIYTWPARPGQRHVL